MSPDASLIKIYNERIEFWNPGTLQVGITIEELISGNYISRIRNIRIASAFKEAQLIERYGSGIKRIQQGFKVYGLKPPLFEEFQGGFRVIVYSDQESISPMVNEKLGEKLGEKLSKTQQSIVAAIRENKKITQKELAKLIGVSDTAIGNNTKYLQERALIKRFGPAKGGHWEVVHSQN